MTAAHHSRAVSADAVVSLVTSGMRVVAHGAAATPFGLLEALARRGDLEGVRLYHMHTEGPAPWTAPECAGRVRSVALFCGPSLREPVNESRADFVPVFLSDIPSLFHDGVIPLDVAMVQLSPPDAHGYCSLGTSVDCARAAVDSARFVVAEINERMPRTLGNTAIPFDRLDAFCVVDRALPGHRPGEESEVEAEIGGLVAALVEDRATLQLGIGAIPDAVLASLTHHRDLGVHTEMFSDGVIDLVERGVINGSRKKVHPGKLVSAFLLGTRRLYDFVDDNPKVAMLVVDYVNDTAVIRRNPKVTAINSAIEVDLTGQVVADSIGMRQYSGVGGQMDFIRGASLSPDGKPIIALPSSTARGASKIAAVLQPGAGVVTTRAHVHYIVTEYGVAYLYGKNLRQRARALIQIAHPDQREALERAAHERFKMLPESRASAPR